MEWEKLLSLKRQVEKEKEADSFNKYPSSELEKDYQEIISSAAFRRLQDKTQVFPLDKSDFVRTRLTHSLEVSAIARRLGIMVTQNKSEYKKKAFQDAEIQAKIPEILSCAGLLHDIGNPPFGHFGEVVIGEWFRNQLEKDDFTFKEQKVKEILSEQERKDLIHFEGNAQALRILSKIRHNVEGYDVNLSYGVLNTLIKYPVSSMEFDTDAQDIKKHKPGYYYAEQEIMQAICQETGTAKDSGFVRHPLVYLMEAADDIAYSTADLEDALKKGLFTLDQFMEYFEREAELIQNKAHKSYSLDWLKDLQERIEKNERNKENELVAFQKWMVVVRKWLMNAAAFGFSQNYDAIMEGNYKHDIFYNTNHEETIEILKGAMKEFVYNDREILKLELAAKKIIDALLDDFVHAVLYWEEEDDTYKMSKADKKLVSMISENYKEDYEHVKTGNPGEDLYLRFLMVTDYISGMTDSYAKNLYRELNGMD